MARKTSASLDRFASINRDPQWLFPSEVLVRHDRLSRPTNTAHGGSAYCRILLWPPSTHGTRYPIRDSPPSCVDGTVPGGSIRKRGGFVMIWGTRGHELSPVVYSTSLFTNNRGAGWMTLAWLSYHECLCFALTMSMNMVPTLRCRIQDDRAGRYGGMRQKAVGVSKSYHPRVVPSAFSGKLHGCMPQ